MRFTNFIRSLILLEDDVEPVVPLEEIEEIEDVCDKNKSLERKLMRIIDNIIKEGLPARENTSLLITSKEHVDTLIKCSNMVLKVICNTAADKQFILKNMNHVNIYIYDIAVNSAIDLFECNDLPMTATKIDDTRKYLIPGDIICYGDCNNLHVYQYRGAVLSTEDILSGNIPMDEKIVSQGPSAVKLAYLKSMADNNVYNPYRLSKTTVDDNNENPSDKYFYPNIEKKNESTISNGVNKENESSMLGSAWEIVENSDVTILQGSDSNE